MKRSCQPLVGLKPPLSSASCGLSTVCIALALLTAPTASAQDLSFLTNGLVAHYPLNGDAKDYSGHGNDGTFVNVLTVPDRFGRSDGAVHTVGANSYVQIPSSPELAALEATHEITVSMWGQVRPDTSPILCVWNPTNDGGWEFSFARSSIFLLLDQNPWPNYTPDTWYYTTDCSALLPEGWSHVVWTGSRSSQRVAFYVNGQTTPVYLDRDGQRVVSTNAANFRLGAAGGPAYLGFSPLGPDEFPVGYYSDLRIYSRALSEIEVCNLYDFESNANLTNTGPIIVGQPVGRAVGVGEDLTLTVRAYGSWPLSFQWRKGLTELSGATQSKLYLTDVTLDDTGDYSVVVSNEFGTVTSDTAGVTVVIRPTRLFVSAESPNPTAPFTNWTTAAREIQQAVDIAASGAEILVGDGIYATGGRAVEGTVTNRVAVDRAVHLRSVNGPESTLIRGTPAPGGGAGDGAIRCVYLAGGASLTGFTLTNGVAQGDGGGAWCESTTNVFLTNCVLTANVGSSGGGAYRGTLFHCTLMGNSASSGGGACGSTLYDCVVSGNAASSGWDRSRGGGGVASCTLYNSSVNGNSAEWEGGGANRSTLYNCKVFGNSAPTGGGTHSSTLHNCTVTGNTAVFSLGSSSDSGMGGGVQGGAVRNSIVYGNYAYQGANWNNATFEHSCTTPLPTNGIGNIEFDPQLTWDAHLLPTSPCIGVGNAAYTSGVDLDGQAWAEVPSMGADEAAPDAARLRIHCSLEAVGVDYEQGFLAANADPSWTAVWDFDDGTRITNQWLVSHAWQAPGTYTVRLTAYGAELPDGATTSASVAVVPDRLHYVNAANPTPAPPYTSWETAATSIQDAVEASTSPGRTILVTNGVYQTGDFTLQGMNRVALPDYVTLRSVNGPQLTIIDGGGTNRCVHLARTASICGFTLTGGKAQRGAGVYGGTAVNCVVNGNTADDVGGGLYLSIVRNCRFTGNSAAYWGGGAYHSTLHGSVLSDNSGSEGGASESILYNCTLAWNGQSPYNSFHNCIVLDRHDDSKFEYSCASPLPEGLGNIEADPEFVDLGSGDFHLRPGSPCISGGNAAHATGTDLNGEPWANPPSMGAHEAAPDATRLRIQHALEEVGVDYAQKFAVVHADPSWDFLWDFGDGTYVTNQYLADHAWQEPGSYTLRLTAYDPAFPQGISVTSHVRVVPDRLHYVNVANPTPAAPYTSWETAATSIQDAVDATVGPGRTILVTNGVYQTGEVVHQRTNRVTLPDYVALRSVNGPDVTIIDGGGTNRCVHLARTASISGFTLSGGKADPGGGAFGGVLKDCVLRANAGSGAADATLHDCLLERNDGVGAAGSTLYDCVLTGNSGRGADGSTLHRCTLTQNRGGGASGGTLYNCILTGNSGVEHGGGAAGSTLHNCTVTGNSATMAGGGVYEGRMVNSIVQLNQAPTRANWTHGDAGSISFAYSCISPLPTSGVGNISTDPLFVDAANGDFRLRPGSPCIDAGDPLSRLVDDILAVRRPLDGDGDGIACADMGAYELNPYRFEAAMAVNTQGMQFTVRGEPGKTVRIDRSSDLLVWEPVATVPLPAGGQTLIDPAAVGEQRLFYRLVKP